MLSQLDTLVGFVVVMSIVSMLIMVATQIASSLCGLRGLNLFYSLETLFRKLEPEIHDEGCRWLIDDLLTHPAISDTIMALRKKPGLLSKLPGYAWLRHRWARATAVRPDELLDLLHETAAAPIGAFFGQLQQMGTALQALEPLLAASPVALDQVQAAALAVKAAREAMLRGAPDEKGTAAWKQAVDAYGTAEAALAGAGVAGAKLDLPAGAARQALQACLDALTKLKAEEARLAAGAAVAAHQIALAVRKAMGAAVAAEQLAATEVTRFEKWFNSAQDRAQQWFTMHTRMWTVIAAFVAAFGLQLDTVQLIRLLENNPDVRAKLVARADALGRQAATQGAQPVTPAMEQRVVADLQKSYGPGADASALDALGPLPPGSNLNGAVAWLGEKLGSNPDKVKIVSDYDAHLRALVLEQQTQQFSGLLTDHSLGSIQLLPNPYPFKNYWAGLRSHLVGILLSVALLSLGGPFWFSLLKQLASLRTALADAVDQQRKQSDPPPAAAKP